jgi:hypothetical protein
MSILDQILQDQEAAKAALGAALNQKAFDILDSISSNEQIEVVMYDDEDDTNESVEDLTEEELEEAKNTPYPKNMAKPMTDADIKAWQIRQAYEKKAANANKSAPKFAKALHAARVKHDDEVDESVEEQLDEASVKLNLGYYEVHHGGQRVGKYVAKYEAKEHAADLNAKAANAATKARLAKLAKARAKNESVEDESTEGLAEGLGSLAGLSKHLIKTVTAGRAYGVQGAGEHSEVETHAVKNKSGHRAILNKALDAGHVPVVYVNGKIHSAGKSNSSSYGRPDYAIHSGDEQQTQRQVTYSKGYRSGGKMHYPEPHVGQNPRYSKGDALEKLTPGHEASFYKENKVEVKVIHPDKERQKLHAQRTNARPETQTNYVNTKPGDKHASQYVDGKTKTSVTSAGDNLKSIKTAAALKLATQKLGGDNSSANKKAMDLHAELGAHLAKGDHKNAINTANKLADHVRQQGLSTHADKIADYAKNLKDLKSRYDKSYAKSNLAKLRGDKVDESEELTEALEAMLVEMLDTNEAVVGGSVKKDHYGNILHVKTVPDSAKLTPAQIKAHHDKIQKERQKEHEARSSTRSSGQPLDTEE